MAAMVPVANRRKWLRLAVFGLGGLEAAALLVVLAMVLGSGQLTSGEALSRSIGWAILAIYGLPCAARVGPALVLAVLDRRLWLALALCVLVIPILIIAVRIA